LPLALVAWDIDRNVNRTPHLPQQPLALRLDKFATLLGYDLSTGKTPVYAGEQLTVTLYDRSEMATPLIISALSTSTMPCWAR
jgi:hypothetical protein